MLNYITLVLGLAIWLKVAVVIKEAGDYKSYFINYIPNISIKIDSIIIK